MTMIRESVRRFGRLVSMARHWAPAPPRAGRPQILSFGVEMIINLFRDGSADPLNLLQVGEPGTRHRAGRAEMVQQRLLAPCPDPWDLVERRGGQSLGALCPMCADREPVRFV